MNQGSERCLLTINPGGGAVLTAGRGAARRVVVSDTEQSSSWTEKRWLQIVARESRNRSGACGESRPCCSRNALAAAGAPVHGICHLFWYLLFISLSFFLFSLFFISSSLFLFTFSRFFLFFFFFCFSSLDLLTLSFLSPFSHSLFPFPFPFPFSPSLFLLSLFFIAFFFSFLLPLL